MPDVKPEIFVARDSVGWPAGYDIHCPIGLQEGAALQCGEQTCGSTKETSTVHDVNNSLSGAHVSRAGSVFRRHSLAQTVLLMIGCLMPSFPKLPWAFPLAVFLISVFRDGGRPLPFCELRKRSCGVGCLRSPLSASRLAIPSEIVQDSCSANFVLDRECSDTTLAQFLDASTLVLDGISPNPTTGLIQLTLRFLMDTLTMHCLKYSIRLAKRLECNQSFSPPEQWERKYSFLIYNM